MLLLTLFLETFEGDCFYGFICFCSPDCALFVCDFIERLLRGEEVPRAMDLKLMQMKRANIAYQLLSDKNHSWEPEPETVPVEIVPDVVDDKASDKGGAAGDTFNSIISDAITFVVENVEQFDD